MALPPYSVPGALRRRKAADTIVHPRTPDNARIRGRFGEGDYDLHHGEIANSTKPFQISHTKPVTGSYASDLDLCRWQDRALPAGQGVAGRVLSGAGPVR